jgi:hypothetical protein
MQLPPRKRTPLSPDEAEALAIDALKFLGEDASRLAAFLASTGLGPAELRRQAGSVEFQAGLLDFIASDESLLLVFASERRIDPATVLAARRQLMPDASHD